MAGPVIKASQLQQPPPEEIIPRVQPQLEPTRHMAWRLHSAHAREMRWRKLQIGQCDLIRRPSLRVDRINKAWWDLARTLMCANIDNPERFIHAQWRYSAPPVAGIGDSLLNSPCFLQLPTEELLIRFKTYDAKADCWLTQELVSAGNTFTDSVVDAAAQTPGCAAAQLWINVLSNPRYEISPLFAYSIAMAEHFTEIAAERREEAIDQMLTDPIGYAKIWTRVLPRELVQRVGKIIRVPLAGGRE